MRPYAALDTRFDVRDTDCGGNVHFGRAAAVGNLPGKGGDIHATIRNTRKKKRTRTLFNKRARQSLLRDTKALVED